MSQIPDPIQAGLRRGWKVYGGRHAALPQTASCDVAIVGSGAGAGVTAELLTRAGLKVILVEEGPLKSSSDFKQLESEAYGSLYQESMSRKTKDKAISILQGRSVGGGTTVNWTSSFRTPHATLNYWQQQFGLKDFHAAGLAPYFEQVERRLNIAPWSVAPNENNELLRRGASKLGISAEVIPRNVKNCWNLGSCGMGCPTNAKQSMLITTIPAALDAGAELWVESWAQRLDIQRGKVQALLVQPVSANGVPQAGAPRRIIAKHFVVAGGAINSPGLLLRSDAPDPHGKLGRRTFLHPVALSAALLPQKVEGWQGAPQSIYSDHFLNTQPIDGPLGYKLEAPPIHPVVFSTMVPGMGAQYHALLSQFAHTHVLLALLRDGFHEQAPGGRVVLRSDGSPVLDYPLTDFVMDGLRRSLLSMAEIQFSAGAREVFPVHENAENYKSWAQAQKAILALPMKPYLMKVVSAHQMGGCGMAADPVRGVVRPDGVHWQIDNLSVHDGSIFPTSIGANPQLSIYGLVNRLSQGLVRRLTGQDLGLA